MAHFHFTFLMLRKVHFCGLLLFFCVSMAGCGTIELPDEPQQQTKPHKVTIHTRSSSKEAVMLPIDVVAFSENGSYVTHQRLTKAEDKLTLSLSEGKYRLVAFSGVGNYVFPNGGVTLKSTISHSILDANPVATASSAGAQLPAGIALMRGEAEVEVGKKRNAVDIILGHTMSAVEFRLSQIPQEVEQVRVRLSSLYDAINWEGRYEQPNAVTLTAQRAENGDWIVPQSYVFPTTSERTVATIALITHDEEQNYAYTLEQSLTAGTPYRFWGTFQAEAKNFTLAGNLTAAEWRPVVEQHFSFGSKSSVVGGDESNELQPNLPVPPNVPFPVEPKPRPNPSHPNPPSEEKLVGFPQVGTLWKGKFLVASVHRITDTEADVMLLAKEQQEDSESANSVEGGANDAVNYAAEYKEDGESNWSIPTKEEAAILARNFNGEALEAVNRLLESIRATQIYVEVQGKKTRYLCDEGRYSFVFAEKPEIRKGTTKGRNFVIRLVKHVRVHKQ